LQTANLAGVMAAKQTSSLIPLCHPLALEKVSIRFEQAAPDLHIFCEARITSKTGVEMEALTGVSIAALTVYDMCKALSHDIQITSIRLESKQGGKNDFVRGA
jgi:cyclic pyranopterin phosphate synthase